jgi:hypothetical protein
MAVLGVYGMFRTACTCLYLSLVAKYDKRALISALLPLCFAQGLLLLLLNRIETQRYSCNTNLEGRRGMGVGVICFGDQMS